MALKVETACHVTSGCIHIFYQLVYFVQKKCLVTEAGKMHQQPTWKKDLDSTSGSLIRERGILGIRDLHLRSYRFHRFLELASSKKTGWGCLFGCVLEIPSEKFIRISPFLSSLHFCPPWLTAPSHLRKAMLVSGENLREITHSTRILMLQHDVCFSENGKHNEFFTIWWIWVGIYAYPMMIIQRD